MIYIYVNAIKKIVFNHLFCSGGGRKEGWLLIKQRPAYHQGFTLLELLVVIFLISTITGIAIPRYAQYQENTKKTIAITEINVLSKEITAYELSEGRLPDNLADLDTNYITDPWGNPYQYNKVEGTPGGRLRKDHFMVPINTDYDLYSMGPDGKSQPPFTSGQSQDDIVRANSGEYIGTVSNY